MSRTRWNFRAAYVELEQSSVLRWGCLSRALSSDGVERAGLLGADLASWAAGSGVRGAEETAERLPPDGPCRGAWFPPAPVLTGSGP